ncbi:hypothetical protein K450DRAFT_202592 [Umbelopsis ramanniana AG]|uniref:Uncharacterized protein n=1 Tax=Umbelopsis ramanniana AG TaxID=1314678 RepID=A0AAD5E3Q0_UMBRA|nr:uncharacterized protein K450DRAFT_202592 [Umbelopsis ramanniana AG]KAI8575780.1 hypothetical protein K450DRAFT_202592 [Umbelopsis ramanniana AG]
MVFASSQHQFVFSPLRWGRIHLHAHGAQKQCASSSTLSHEKENGEWHSGKHSKKERSTLIYWNSLWKRVSADMRPWMSDSMQDLDEEDDDTLENIPTCYDIPVDTKLHYYLRQQTSQRDTNNMTTQNTAIAPKKKRTLASQEHHSAAMSSLRKLNDSHRTLREMIHINQVLRRVQEDEDHIREMERYKIQKMEQDPYVVSTVAAKRNIHNLDGETGRLRPSYVQQTMITTGIR